MQENRRSAAIGHHEGSDRYARQIQFAPIGKAGQSRILDSSAVVLGCGALGSVASELLARAGVGQVTIIDRDIVEWTNLQRQSLFDEHDVKEGRTKAEAARDRLTLINSSIDIKPIVADVTQDNIESLLGNPSIVIDASDNFSIRFLLNDWSLKHQIPWVHGGCVAASGQVRLFSGSGSPCFRCLVPEPPPPASVDTCDTAGVVNAATHLIASLQVAEAIKWLSGKHDVVNPDILSIDLWSNRYRTIKLHPKLSETCVACRENQYDFLDCSPENKSNSSSVVMCGRKAVQITPSLRTSVDPKQISERWKMSGTVQRNPFFVRLTLPTNTADGENLRITLFMDGRSLIEGTDSLTEARSLHDRFIGG